MPVEPLVLRLEKNAPLSVAEGDGNFKALRDHANALEQTVNAILGAAFPVGTVIMYGGSAAPNGWIECDGASVLRVGAYANLFTAIGTAFGSVDGTHFTLPDFRGRAPIGVGTGAGLTARALAAQVGAEAITLVKENLPDIAPAKVVNIAQAGAASGQFYPVADQKVSGVTSSLDGGDKVNPRGVDGGGAGLAQTTTAVMQPSLTVKFLIKY